MAIAEETNATLAVLKERELRVRRLGKDGEEKLTGDVPEAFGCPNNETCIFGGIVSTGGSPCNQCRHLGKGDYFIPEAQ